MKNNMLLLMATCLVLLSACSKNLTYFTENIQNDFDLSESELKKIQFYVSEDIRLIKASNSGKSAIENGQIKIKDQKKVNEVVIEKGTPGTFVFSPKSDKLAICFDKDQEKYLVFGPNKKAKGRYVLLAKNWKKRGGIITYGNEEYQTSSDSAYAALMVDISKAKSVSRNSQTASGSRVGK